MDRTMMTVVGAALVLVSLAYLRAEYINNRPPHWVTECATWQGSECTEYRRTCETGAHYRGDGKCL
jgi:hypothetical protein